MKLSSFKFTLPTKLIASHPAENREEARLMVVHKKTGKIEHKTFKDLLDYFGEGDVVVLNDTQIFPSKLYGSKEKTGAKIEVFLLRELSSSEHLWDTLVEPARKIRVGNKLYFGDSELVAEVLDNTTSRGRTLKFLFDGTQQEFQEVIDQLGLVPLPSQLKRKQDAADKERYQTVYAQARGAVVPPFAGFHFSSHLLKRLELQGVHMPTLTLHVGLSSLKIIDVEDLTKYKIGSEQFIISDNTVAIVNTALDDKKRVCAVGTSTSRGLETSVSVAGRLKPVNGWTNKLIFPPYDFKICNSLITNFHLPESLPLVNATAFGGYDLMMEAYQEAIKEQYKEKRMKFLVKNNIRRFIAIGVAIAFVMIVYKKYFSCGHFPIANHHGDHLRGQVAAKKLPRHVAVMMDGNGRWAIQQGKPRVFGHANALQSVENAITACVELNIPYLTLFAFSTENWERPFEEVETLMKLFVTTTQNKAQQLVDHNIKLQVIGDIERLPEDCKLVLNHVVQATQHNTGLTLVVALSYSGRWDITQAAQALINDVLKEGKQPQEINEETFKKYLATGDLPDPDLLIRTGGDVRISNFLLWQLAYTELVFIDKYWPDFEKEDVYQAVIKYQQRDRRIFPAIGVGFWLAMLGTYSVMANVSHGVAGLSLDYHRPATYVIEKIEFIGTKSLEPETLLAISSLKVGDTLQIPGSGLTYAIEQLWKQKLIENVSVYATQVIGNQVALAFHIVESPRLSTYTLKGVKKREENKLADKVKLARGRIITPKLIRYIHDTLKKDFLQEGYKDAKINITTLPDEDDRHYNRLVIEIEKGEKVIINRIHMKGNEHISSDVLRACLQHLQEKPRFTLIKDMAYQLVTLQPFRKHGLLWKQPNLGETEVYLRKHMIFSSTKFDKKKYLQGQQKILAYYHTQGYRDAVIVKEQVSKAGKGLIDISFTIDEGEKYYIRNIQWVGNHLHDSKTLNRLLNIRSGSVYNAQLLQERLYASPTGNDVSSLYMDDGYLFFHIEPVEVAIEGNQVDLALRIQEGSQATINKVMIQGNTYTNERVIRRELYTLPGDKFSRRNVVRSIRELAMLNLFNPQKTDILPIPNPGQNTVDLLYKVEEALNFDAKASMRLNPITFMLDVGTNNFSLANALRGKRPLGDRQTFHIQAEFQGKKYQNFTFQFIEPWLMGKRPTAFSLAVTRTFKQGKSEEDQSLSLIGLAQNKKLNVEEGGVDSKLGSFGIKSSLNRRLSWPDDYCVLTLGAGYRYYDYSHYNIADLKDQEGTMQEWLGEITLERNSTDQAFYPTKGSIMSLQFKFTPPYSWFSRPSGKKNWQEQFKLKEYYQTLIDIHYCYNFFGDWVTNLFVGGGFLGSYTPNHGVGPFNRFSMGGGSIMPEFSLLGSEVVSLRGYPDGALTPRDHEVGYQGGGAYHKVSMELRHPIVKSSMFFIYGFLFAEAGNTWANYRDWKPFALYKSIGVGFRCQLPMVGIVGFGWGYGFNQYSQEKVRFYFSIGSNIR
eukprot:gene744-922_t